LWGVPTFPFLIPRFHHCSIPTLFTFVHVRYVRFSFDFTFRSRCSFYVSTLFTVRFVLFVSHSYTTTTTRSYVAFLDPSFPHFSHSSCHSPLDRFRFTTTTCIFLVPTFYHLQIVSGLRSPPPHCHVVFTTTFRSGSPFRFTFVTFHLTATRFFLDTLHGSLHHTAFSHLPPPPHRFTGSPPLPLWSHGLRFLTTTHVHLHHLITHLGSAVHRTYTTFCVFWILFWFLWFTFTRLPPGSCARISTPPRGLPPHYRFRRSSLLVLLRTCYWITFSSGSLPAFSRFTFARSSLFLGLFAPPAHAFLSPARFYSLVHTWFTVHFTHVPLGSLFFPLFCHLLHYHVHHGLHTFLFVLSYLHLFSPGLVWDHYGSGSTTGSRHWITVLPFYGSTDFGSHHTGFYRFSVSFAVLSLPFPRFLTPATRFVHHRVFLPRSRSGSHHVHFLHVSSRSSFHYGPFGICPFDYIPHSTFVEFLSFIHSFPIPIHLLLICSFVPFVSWSYVHGFLVLPFRFLDLQFVLRFSRSGFLPTTF